MCRAHPPHGAEHIVSFLAPEADDLPAALPVPAQVNRQHVETRWHEVAGEVEFLRLVREEPVTEQNRAPLLGAAAHSGPWDPPRGYALSVGRGEPDALVRDVQQGGRVADVDHLRA